MGVKDLWKLLEPTGRPVNLDKLQGLVFAIDVSVWLHQAVHGATDRAGQPLQAAHLALLFSRICKLLHYQIKPVFVFDGATPTLKQQTLAQRSQRRQAASKRGERAEEKQRKKYMQAKILEQLTGEKSSIATPRPSSQPDMFDLPPLPEDVFDNDRSPVLDTSVGSFVEDVRMVDVESSEFASLPPEVQHEVLQERQEMERHTHTDPRTLPNVANDFSSYQLSKLMKRSRLNRRLEDVRRALKSSETSVGILGGGSQPESCQVEASRIVSSDSAHYILVRGVDLEGGASQDELGSDTEVGGARSEVDGDVVLRRDDVSEGEGVSARSAAVDSHRDAVQETETGNGRLSSVGMSLDEPSVKAMDSTECDITQCRDGELKQVTTASVSQLHVDGEYNERVSLEDSVPASSEEIIPSVHVVSGAPEQSLEDSASVTRAGVVDISQPSTASEFFKAESTVSTAEPEIAVTSDRGTERPTTECGLESKPEAVEDGDIREAGDSGGAIGGENREQSKSGESGEDVDIGTIEEDSDVSVGWENVGERLGSSGVGGGGEIGDEDRLNVGGGGEKNEGRLQLEGRDDNGGGRGVGNVGEGRLEGGDIGEGRLEGGGVWEEGILQLSPSEAQSQLEREVGELGRETERQRRAAAGLNSQVYREAQELLSLFGLPYILSPMEAEAQCAFLDHTHQTDGSITDDSDVFLFGGQRTYRHFFSQDKEPAVYDASEIKSVLGLTRERMVCLAYLLGSDYTHGLEGVGVVNAMEVIGQFRGDGIDTLEKLKEWHATMKSTPGLTTKSSLERKLLALDLPPDFPSLSVWQAYMDPEVDESTEQFQWGSPDLDLIRKFMLGHVGWDQDRVDSVLLPVLKRVHSKERKITSYFPPPAGFSASAAPSTSLPPSTNIKSKRLRNVVTRITGVSSDQNTNDEVSPRPKRVKTKNDSSSEEDINNAGSGGERRGRGRKGRGRGRGVGRGRKGGNKSSPDQEPSCRMAKLSASSSSSSDEDK